MRSFGSSAQDQSVNILLGIIAVLARNIVIFLLAISAKVIIVNYLCLAVIVTPSLTIY
jgi:hypothetical protein